MHSTEIRHWQWNHIDTRGNHRQISNIVVILPAIKDMFTTLRYDFEQNHIQGDYLVIFELMEELRMIAHTYPQKKPGAIKNANGVLAIE